MNVDGVSVGGLSSSAYGGLLFWDQDFWMYDPIAITNPDYARQILNARVTLYEQAKRNVQADYVQERYLFNNKSILYRGQVVDTVTLHQLVQLWIMSIILIM